MNGIGSGLKVWLLVAVVVAGVYVLPSVVATFAGSHTLELNQTGRVLEFKCGECHQYVVNEMTAGNSKGLVGEKHRNASYNQSYMTYVANMSNATGYSDMCKMCHYTNDTTVAGTHTKVIVRPCTWSTCHGNSTDDAQEDYYTQAGQVGRKLGNNTEVHSNWFTGLETGETTNYTSPDTTTNVTKSYYACIGCHSHTGIDFSITRLNKYILTIDKTGTYSVNATSNTTSINTTTSVGSQGTKWN